MTMSNSRAGITRPDLFLGYHTVPSTSSIVNSDGTFSNMGHAFAHGQVVDHTFGWHCFNISSIS